jgi:NAD(P)-dependent dehydrogenase (short-subunit alcohol dehydrogenase family)
MELESKAVVVTGGAGNIGAVAARRMGAEGARVVVSDRPESGVQDVADEIGEGGGTAVAHEGDLSVETDIEEMVATCLREFGRIDALINVAAAPRSWALDRDLETMELDYWDDTMAVNVRGPMLACKYAVPAMVAQGGGSIVNFTSTAAYAGDLGLIAYGSSKAALLGLTRALATIYGRQGIRCNAIAPSGVWTEAAWEAMGEERRKRMQEWPLTPRLGLPEDVANMVVFLASDKSEYMTGQTYFVDGGSLAHQPWVKFE